MSNTLTGVHRRLLASITAIVMISAVILPNASFGQAVTSGTIEIRVADSTGAALPGATVTLTNAERGVLRTGVSDERSSSSSSWCRSLTTTNYARSCLVSALR